VFVFQPEHLVESSSAMKLAFDKLLSANDQFQRERQDFEERCREAKEVVTALREEVQQKNDLIATMKLQVGRLITITLSN